MSVELPEFLKWLDQFMSQPKESVIVRDLWGNYSNTDASKVLAIAPNKLQSCLDDPELRKHIVIPIP